MDVSATELPANTGGFAIHIEDPADCQRYSGCIVRDVAREANRPPPCRSC